LCIVKALYGVFYGLVLLFACRLLESHHCMLARPLHTPYHTLPPTSAKTLAHSLDKCFENVCELDLIFHSDRVHYCLDEIVMGGMVLETNMSSILQSIKDQGKMHADSLRTANPNESVSTIRERIGAEQSTWQYNW